MAVIIAALIGTIPFVIKGIIKGGKTILDYLEGKKEEEIVRIIEKSIGIKNLLENLLLVIFYFQVAKFYVDYSEKDDFDAFVSDLEDYKNRLINAIKDPDHSLNWIISKIQNSDDKINSESLVNEIEKRFAKIRIKGNFRAVRDIGMNDKLIKRIEMFGEDYNSHTKLDLNTLIYYIRETDFDYKESFNSFHKEVYSELKEQFDYMNNDNFFDRYEDIIREDYIKPRYEALSEKT